MAITLDQAKSLQYGDIIYFRSQDMNLPRRYRVNGAPKTWKTRPNEVSVPIKFGLYQYDYMTEAHLSMFFLTWEDATKES